VAASGRARTDDAEIAGAFGLGDPAGDLVLVRRGDTDTWRLETDRGSYFVKGYWAETGGQFVASGLIDQLQAAMAFEARALAAGVDMLLTELPGKLSRLRQSANKLP
jgi:hypothetical protein